MSSTKYLKKHLISLHINSKTVYYVVDNNCDYCFCGI